MLLLTVALGITLSSAPPASAANRTPHPLAALHWAEAQRGKPYIWAATGPNGFDCSGLVYEAYLHQGINIGRDTSAMLASSRLQWIPARDRVRGDLAFYGTGHVEMVTGRGTYGALEPGTLIGWHIPNSWWHPTAFYRVR